MVGVHKAFPQVPAFFFNNPCKSFYWIGRGKIGIGMRPYRATAGHNPVGGWSVLAMLVTLIAMVSAGLLAVDVDGLESGPLTEYVSFEQGRTASDLHGWLFNLLLTVVALHMDAILYYMLRLRHNLIGPMIHAHRMTAEQAVNISAGGA